MMEKLSLSVKKSVKSLSFLFLSILFLLVGCSRNPSPSDDRSTAFYADFVYTAEHTQLCGEVWVEAPRQDSDRLPRNVRLSVKQPNALCGLSIIRKDGEILCEYQGLSKVIDSTDLLRCVDLLLTEDPTAADGTVYEFRYSPDTGVLQSISSDKECLEIKNFKKIASAE